MHKFYCLILFVLFSTVAAQAQTIPDISPKEQSCDQTSAKIMIVGTYHMDNPGLDAKNFNADDVLLPKRQKEIAELNEKLARFKPTKIAVEGAYSDRIVWQSNYKKYLAGQFKLGRNEIYQIGFQIGKMLGLESIYPIDYPMFMSGFRYDEIEFAKPKPNPSPKSDSTQVKPQPPTLSEEDLLLRRLTVMEILLRGNNEQQILKDHAGYLQMLATASDNDVIYEKPDAVANWYKRNLRMFANINRITSFPNDRVLVLVGTGHLKILRDFAIDSPQFCLVEAENYLK